MKKFKSIFILTLLASSTLFISCSEDSLEPILADEQGTEVRNLQELRQYIDGAYSNMADYRYWGRNTIIAGEVRADNVYSNGNSNRFVAFSLMDYDSFSGDVTDVMRYAYVSTANPNIVINSPFVPDENDQAEANHIIGEAHAIRALVHFDLLRMFGQQHVSGGMNGLGISYVKNFRDEFIPRGTVSENLADIYADLDQALALMSSGFNDSERVRITTDAVLAIKSRVATYFRDYATVREATAPLIGKYSITPESSVVESWAQQTTSPSSIFELAQNATESNGINGIANIYRGGSYGDIQLFNSFITDAEFAAGDVRASEDMIKADGAGRLRNMGKYPSGNPFPDNIKVIRYEEMVLNYAEALIETNPTLALQHLNSIPENRGGSTYGTANIDNILKERRKELAFEGFRFDDLARHGRNLPMVDSNLCSQTHCGKTYGDHTYAFPIPNGEINANPHAVQNQGY